MRTSHKLAMAKLAYAVVHTARRLVGLNDRCLVKRRGFNFDLDLSQGIDLTIYLLGSFEPSTARALARLVVPGSTVLDIGANIGAHTIPLAGLVGQEGRVLAFEPTAFAFTKLERNIELNADAKKVVHAYQCFLGAADAEDIPPEIYSSWPLTEAGGLHPKHGGNSNSTTKAVGRSVDSVLAEHGNPRVHLIKLDVDGFECDVLAGASGMMRRDQPVFVMELAPYVLAERGKSLQELLTFFQPFGYRFYDETSERMLQSDANSLSEMIADGESKNIIARVQPAAS